MAFANFKRATAPAGNLYSNAYLQDEKTRMMQEAMATQNMLQGAGLGVDATKGYNAYMDKNHPGKTPIGDALRGLKDKITGAPDAPAVEAQGIIPGGPNAAPIEAQTFTPEGFAAPEADLMMDAAPAGLEADILSEALRVPESGLMTDVLPAVTDTTAEAAAATDALDAADAGTDLLGAAGTGLGYAGMANSLAQGDAEGVAKAALQKYLMALGPLGIAGGLGLSFL